MELSVVFAQLRLDLEAATTPECRRLAVEKAELYAKHVLARECAAVRAQAYEDGRGIRDLVQIKRRG